MARLVEWALVPTSAVISMARKLLVKSEGSVWWDGKKFVTSISLDEVKSRILMEELETHPSDVIFSVPFNSRSSFLASGGGDTLQSAN